MTRILAACMVLALAACAPKEDLNGDGIVDGVREPDSVSQIAPSSPVGSISGAVLNTNNQPIDGVQVTLVLGAGAEGAPTYSTNTTAQGTYSFPNLPGGSTAQLFFSKTGYATARYTTSVPGNAGQFPINNGNVNAGTVTLSQLTGTLKLQVFTASGRPANGAKAYLEVTNTAFITTNGSYQSSIGNFSTSADVDDAGFLTFTGIPDIGELTRALYGSQYIVSIGAIDENNDGFNEWNGSVTSFSAQQLFIDPSRVIILPSGGTFNNIAIVASNLDSFGGAFSEPYLNAVKGSEPITIVFNQAISQNDTTRLIKVVQENCQDSVAVSVTQRSPNTLSIAPASPWTLGQRYNIIVRVTGLESGTTSDFIGYAFAIDPTAPRSVSNMATFQVRKAAGNMMNGAYQPGDTLYVIFDTPVTNQGAAVAVTQFDLDLNGDGMTGGMTGFGEFGASGAVENTGFQIVMREQTQAYKPTDGTFTCKQSGYSSRWEVTGVTFPSSLNIPSNTNTKVVFPKTNSSADTYQSAWGAPILTDVGGRVTIAP